MKRTRLLSFFIFNLFLQFVVAQPLENWEADKIKVVQASGSQTIMHAEALFEDRWDQLPQPQFWKKIMLLSPDSCLINVAANRQVLDKMSIRDWNAQTEEQKTKPVRRDARQTGCQAIPEYTLQPEKMIFTVLLKSTPA